MVQSDGWQGSVSDAGCTYVRTKDLTRISCHVYETVRSRRTWLASVLVTRVVSKGPASSSKGPWQQGPSLLTPFNKISYNWQCSRKTLNLAKCPKCSQYQKVPYPLWARSRILGNWYASATSIAYFQFKFFVPARYWYVFEHLQLWSQYVTLQSKIWSRTVNICRFGSAELGNFTVAGKSPP